MKTAVQHYESKLAFETDPSDLYDLLSRGERVVVIDARKSFAFAEEHIPGAVNLPHREMNAATTAGFDRSALYVVYCDGIGCNASTKGSLNLARLGFDVRELMGGLAWWKFDGYATAGEKAAGGADIACAC